MAGDAAVNHVLGISGGGDQYVTQSQLGSLLDAWYAKKQPLQQSQATPNAQTYTPSYSSDATQQAAGAGTQQTLGAQPMPQQRQDYGWRPSPYMGGYGNYGGGFQTPFSGYGMGMGYGGMGGYGSYGGGYYPSSGFGMGGMGYGQMYNPFSMY